jgi:hypothetical protein
MNFIPVYAIYSSDLVDTFYEIQHLRVSSLMGSAHCDRIEIQYPWVEIRMRFMNFSRHEMNENYDNAKHYLYLQCL